MKYLCFESGGRRFGVEAHEGFLVLDATRTLSIALNAQHEEGALLDRGRLVPLLDFARSMGHEPPRGEGRHRLVLQHGDALVALTVRPLRALDVPDPPAGQAVDPALRGLARLLVAEDLELADGCLHRLDVPMLAQLAAARWSVTEPMAELDDAPR